jgi:3-deoxy-D-manno-octulosonic-acid transferase
MKAFESAFKKGLLVNSKTKLQIGHWVYRLAASLLAGPALLLLWWRGRREPAYRQALIERLGFVHPKPSALGGLWVHVASVGEAQAALTLLPQLEAQWGPESVTVTTQTPAARALLMERTCGRVQPFFAPLDTVSATGRFLRRVQPRMLLLLERELWPEWLWQCEQRAVAVVVANARLKQRSAQRWPYSSQWVRQHLQSLQLALCADAGSARRFGQLGLAPDRIHTLGNLKFDQTVQYDPPADLAATLAGRTVVVAASTHEGDENALLPGWVDWLAKQDSTHAEHHGGPMAPPLLLLAPRHPQRFATVAQRLQAMGLEPGRTLALRSQGHAVGPHTQVLLLDTIGELVHLYPLGTVCLMGGTWAPVGGHNALEPLAAGCPVLFGPHTEQFPDLYAAMAECGAAQCVQAADVWAYVQRIANSQTQADGPHATMQAAGLAFIAVQQGSAVRTLAQLATLPCWPVEPMPAIRVQREGPCVIWTCADAEEAIGHPLAATAFDAQSYANHANNLATGSGRGQAHKVDHDGHTWVLRHYRRGGWVARWVHDTYPSGPTAGTRAMQELLLLRQMRSLGLPVPKPVAAHCQRHNKWLGRHSRYLANILIEHIPNTRNLVQCLREGPLPPEAWQAVGRAIAHMHSKKVFHSDLNAHNILMNDAGQVWLVDFDKCDVRPGQGWKARNLARLQRSLRKEFPDYTSSASFEADWAVLMSAYSAQPQQ